MKAIVEMERPDDISGIRRFLGMVNQLKKLSGPGNSKLNVLGKFQCMLESQDNFSVQDIYV